VGTHNTSLASIGLSSLVVAAVGWRACTHVSPSPRVSPPVQSAEPASALYPTDAALAGAQSVEPGAAPLARLVSEDPARALAEIAAADQREGQQVEQRAALEVRALVSLARIGSAHAKLQLFAERYPHSAELPALVRLTGYHPRPPLQKPAR